MSVREVSEVEFDALMASIERERAAQAERLPDEAACLAAIQDAYTRLKALGWNDAIYCPKDGSSFDSIEMGSTGIHRCHCSGRWPTGSWWVEDAGDLWPARPALWRAAVNS